MPAWPANPSVYEINTWVWLAELGAGTGSSVELNSVPEAEWDALAGGGFDAVWLMGVWQRSPAGIAIANRNKNLLADFRRALPDFQTEDNVGSPYCVRSYAVDQHLGGRQGLATARCELAKRGVRLILDFVPNHVAPDHPWAGTHPEYFIQGTAEDLRNNPSSYIEINRRVYACGKDPYFPSWSDVLQLNGLQPGLRRAVVETVSDIADQCDGVRCDMAMLLLNSVFERTWGSRAGPKPTIEYWDEVIPAVKRTHDNFIFMAEAYWDLEWELQQHGFDFCYDKKLYDRLQHENAESVRLHLCADLTYQGRLLRFIENHDEPRAAAAFTPAKEKAAAVTTSTQAGARMFHEGQFEGRQIRLPVFLGRRPPEPANEELRSFYSKLLAALNHAVFHEGQWRLCERTGWPDNQSCQNIVAWCWNKDDERYLITVNLSEGAAQARIHMRWADLAGRTWTLSDSLSGAVYERSGDELASSGLYVDLPPWSCHLLCCSHAGTQQRSAAAIVGN